jgi:hypothetical protein
MSVGKFAFDQKVWLHFFFQKAFKQETLKFLIQSKKRPAMSPVDQVCLLDKCQSAKMIFDGKA